MRELGRLEQVAFVDQLQPVRDVVVDRAFPFAVGIAAGETTAGLAGRRLGVELPIDLPIVPDPRLRRHLVRILPVDLEELQLLGRGENQIFEIEQKLRRLYPSLNINAIIADIRDAAGLERVLARNSPELG